MKNMFEKAAELERSNTTFALATILSAIGSTPRSKARMIITESGETFGTIGGGLAESYVIKEALDRIPKEQSGIVSYRLDHTNSENSIDMLCGGDLDIFIEIISSSTHLVLVGGGHVNLEIAKLGKLAGFSITVLETRKEFATPDRFPMAKELIVGETIGDAISQVTITPKSAIVIATHEHDKTPLKLLLSEDFGYLGMLGSRKKVAYIKNELIQEGVSSSQLKRVHAPAGFDIGAETPEQIAISIISEMMSVMNHTSGTSLAQKAENLVIVRGGGDIATGTIIRLWNSGFRVLVLETAKPTVIRRTISLAQAVYDKKVTIEGVTAELTDSYSKAKTLMDNNIVPVLVDPNGEMIKLFAPKIVVDAILAKRNLGTTIDMAPLVIGLGPGFTAGVDVDAVIETNRGHDLGRVIWEGKPADDTGIPGVIAGVSKERVLRSPCEGVFSTDHEIGDLVKKGETVALVGDTEVPATIDGVIRGLLSSGLSVTKGFKIGDIDPRGDATYCYRVSDKARAVAGGVLEAILAFDSGRV